MKIAELLIQQTPVADNKTLIDYDDLMTTWEQVLERGGFHFRYTSERNTLTGAILSSTSPTSSFMHDTPVHIKVIGRHMNSSFRCHIGTGKASRPIRSTELCDQMRLLAVFFRAEKKKSQLVAPDFIFFPTWLLHLFQYTQHESTPGRTDVRFLEHTESAKEDHIYRLNHVLNTLFRFNLHDFDYNKLRSAIELSNFLFDRAGLDYHSLPRPNFGTTDEQPALYTTLVQLLNEERPCKSKPMCSNCIMKTCSRRGLCVACYRYENKHGEKRPLRLALNNRPGPRVRTPPSTKGPLSPSNRPPMMYYTSKAAAASTSVTRPRSQKYCANCNVRQTHQWYKNLCGNGHWCETCKSYYLRHGKVRPPELFLKAAKRKVDVRTLVNWSSWSWEDFSPATPSSTHLESRRSSSSSWSSATTTSTSPKDETCSPSSAWSGRKDQQLHHIFSNEQGPGLSNSSSGSSSPISILSSPSTPSSYFLHANTYRLPLASPIDPYNKPYDPFVASVFPIWSPEYPSPASQH
ncbi:hypothetical protein DFQ28_004353 [Apophysomyces sp. BC1034]|nr:hypothetical protein DFQ30_006226 [Apophysomyces sp. BC1015]KAG0178407.1 hypothetical protein DFQ29_003499 [Apophysomyces sp. BC1021]KAG0188795.1 hypothetical protein DFQ28_004353 [Apophysomyces sp. BC1034]